MYSTAHRRMQSRLEDVESVLWEPQRVMEQLTLSGKLLDTVSGRSEVIERADVLSR